MADLATARRLLRLEYSHKLAHITFGKVSLTTQLIQGTYPSTPSSFPRICLSAPPSWVEICDKPWRWSMA